MLFDDYKRKVSNIKIDDFSSLLNIGRKWSGIEHSGITEIKIAVIGNTSIQLIVSVLRAMLTRYDIYADIYEGEYNGILMDVFDDDSDMYSFLPEYIILIPDYMDVEECCPSILVGRSEVEESINEVYKLYSRIFDRIHEKLPKTQIMITNYVTPFFEPLGSLSSNYIFSKRAFYRRFNSLLTQNHPPYVFVLDVEELAEYIGKGNFIDESAYYLSKSGFRLKYIGFYCDLIVRQFEAYMGKVRKSLVIDLDGTLWGGAVGDLGYDGILLDPNDAEGEAFLAFQRYIVELRRRGVIICICSKNDEVNAKEPFIKNRNMILKLSDISLFVANWDDKATNIKRISDQLNIGIDSLVFFDDNPTERELIRNVYPELKVIDVPDDPALYIRALDRAFPFEWNQITREDIDRVETYTDNQARSELMESSIDYSDYLNKLNMKVKCKKLSKSDIERFVQLSNKSNQFNLRTRRYTDAEIINLKNDTNYDLFTFELSDRFSNYGIIACVVLKYRKAVCFIENWVMSCRVIKKGVENYTIEKIVNIAKERSCSQVVGEYVATKKNGIVSDLFDVLGFDLFESSFGVKKYILNEEQMDEYKQNYYIEEVV